MPSVLKGIPASPGVVCRASLSDVAIFHRNKFEESLVFQPGGRFLPQHRHRFLRKRPSFCGKIALTEQFARVPESLRRRVLEQTCCDSQTLFDRFERGAELADGDLSLILCAQQKGFALLHDRVPFALFAVGRGPRIQIDNLRVWQKPGLAVALRPFPLIESGENEVRPLVCVSLSVGEHVDATVKMAALGGAAPGHLGVLRADDSRCPPRAAVTPTGGRCRRPPARGRRGASPFGPRDRRMHP